MLRTFRILISAVLSFIALNLNAQLASNPIHIEMTPHYEDPYNEPAPVCAPIDLEGYITYDIYLVFEDPQDELQAIYGIDPQGNSGNCVPDACDLFFDVNCNVFQHPIGGPFFLDNPCAFWPFYPSLEFDSFLSIGYECSQGSDIPSFWLANPLMVPCEAQALLSFEGDDDCDYFDGGDLIIDSNALFSAAGIPAGPDLMILIARITTCGDISFTFNVQILDNGVPGQAVQYDCLNTSAIDMVQLNPCTNFPMTFFNLDEANCFGDENVLTFDEGGYGYTDYSLHNSLNDAVVDTYDEITGDLIISDLNAGSYYMSMIDSVGCRDTSAVFVIEAVPDLLTINADVVNQMLCFGDNDGSISLACAGGTEPYQLTYTLNNGPVQNTTCGTTLTNLLCGQYEFTLIDDNDCEAADIAIIDCPANIILQLSFTNVLCFGQDDGTVTGTVTGGTGNLSVVWTPQGDFPTYTPAPGPINLNATGLGSGNFNLTVTDENGCEEMTDISIIEPAPFSADTTVIDVSCFGGTDGCIELEISGGTPPTVTTATDMDSGTVFANICALPAGMYQIDIVDDNGCPLMIDSIMVEEPLELEYLFSDTAVSCFGQADGSIFVTDITGGTAQYTYSISPGSGIESEGVDNVNYTNLPANTYSVTITDAANCVVTIPGIVITSPAQLALTIEATDVSCFGANDGIVILEATGGTGVITLDPDGISLPITLNDLAPDTYTFTVSDESGCADEASIIIFEPELMEASILSTQNVGCGGDCDGLATIQAVGGTAPFNWQIVQPLVGNDSGTLDPNPYEFDDLCADPEYIIVVSDFRGCLDTLEFSINEPEPILVSYLLTPPTCTGMFDGAAVVSVSGGTGTLTTVFEPEEIEVVENDSVTFTLPGLGEGQILITVFDESGCSLEEQLDVVPAIITDMVLETFSSPESCWNEQDGTATVAVLNGTPPISYEWNDDNQQTTPTAIGLSPNIQYTVVVTDSIGCTLSTSVFVEPTIGCFFIANALTPNGDGVNDFWVLGGLEYFPTANIQVFNRWGQIVFESKGYSSPWEGRYKGENLPVADYYFIIEYDSSKDPIMGTVTVKY